MAKYLSDDQVHEALARALKELSGQADTVRGATALAAAKKALILLQFGLLQSKDRGDDHIDGVVG